MTNLCWFCKSRPSFDGSTVVLKMHGNVVRTRVAGNKTQVQWQNLSIEVPRCSICKSGHDKAKSIEGIGWLIGIVVSIPVVIAILAPMLGGYKGPIPVVIPLNLAGVFLVLGLIVLPFVIVATPFGLIGKWIGRLTLPSGTTPEDQKDKFPSVETMKNQGWKVGEKPDGVR